VGHFWSDWLARHLGYLHFRQYDWLGHGLELERHRSNQVKSYASAVLGWHWGWKITGTGLPVQIFSQQERDLWLELPSHPGQTIDVSYDLSLTLWPTQATPTSRRRRS